MPRLTIFTSAFLAGMAALLLLAPTADAQRNYRDNQSYGQRGQGDKAGDFDYYALVLSWSPTHCDSPAGRRDQTQCSPRRGRGFSFVLHGLWPQYFRGYPESCRTPFKPFVSNRTIESMMDIMPSKGLIIHEYRKHGTCSGMTPEDYYALSSKLYRQIRIPAAYREPTKEQFVSPDQLIKQFTDANPGLDADMLAVVCRGSGNRLREVRICFSKNGKPQRCGSNEKQRNLCRANRMFVPPIRYSR